MRAPTLLLALALCAPHLTAQASTGPIIESGGPVWEISNPTFETPLDMEFRAAFEVVNPASQPDRVNQSLNTVARFLNMHGQAGVPKEQIEAAAVVHGGAAFAMMDNEAYRERYGVDNPNIALIRELTEAGVPVVLCGQSAASRGIDTDRLVDGVQVALSAMTALQVLQARGYRLNLW